MDPTTTTSSSTTTTATTATTTTTASTPTRFSGSPNMSRGLSRLKCICQTYDWGKPATTSLVAQLAKAGGSLATIDENKKYAELWMGTHISGPSFIQTLDDEGREITLKEFLMEQPLLMCTDISKAEPSGNLPYLFKVLSINKALSIQAHPNKSRAEELFRLKPDIYKDDNHKPEMACALTDFEALLGFETIENIVTNIDKCEELKALLEEDGGNKGKEAVMLLRNAPAGGDKESLKQLFAVLMTSDPLAVKTRVEHLVHRVENVDSSLHPLDALAVRMHEQFPHDVGIFCVYVLCYRKLLPGQAVFLAANEPHAYLSGDCMEVMANSDNVVRAGLTPKFRDVEELVSMLTYTQPPTTTATNTTTTITSGFHPAMLLPGQPRDDYTVIYTPPDPAVTEFQLERTVYNNETQAYHLTPSSFASIIICVEGRGEAKWDSGIGRSALARGAVFFQPAGSRISITGQNIILFRVTKRGAA
jgi:mannose-6-phosphate isomerase